MWPWLFGKADLLCALDNYFTLRRFRPDRTFAASEWLQRLSRKVFGGLPGPFLSRFQ